MNYKDEFYANYLVSHLNHRGKVASLDRFKGKAAYFDERWTRFLPDDKNARVLDVGCGSGLFVWWLQQRGYAQAEGIDCDEEQIAIGTRLGVVNLIKADLLDFLGKERRERYELVVLRDVLEHFPKPEECDVLRRCLEVLAVDGRIVVQVPNAQSPFFGRILYGDFTHDMAFTESSLHQVLSVTGFERICLYSCPPRIKWRKNLLRLFLWKFVERFYQFLLYAETGVCRRIVTETLIGVAFKPADRGLRVCENLS